jgi:stage II sporulation protein D
MKLFYPLCAAVFALGGCVTPMVSTPPSDNNFRAEIEASPADSTEVQGSSPQIRVAIEVRQNSVRLVAPEEFILSGFPWGTPDIQRGEKRYQEITLTPDQLYDHKAYIEPIGEGQIKVNGKSFRGSVEIVEASQGTLTVINQLSLEDYVMGVLAGEIPRNWPLEALKAQAIAARTFAVLYRMEAREKGQPYDLENTALFQMYQGSELVNENIQKAVMETKNEILTFDGKPIAAFFHSNCGGHTSGAVGVWSQDRPYLRPVSCPFGNNGEHFRWKAEISIADMIRKLRNAGVKIGDVVRIEIISRDEGDRIQELSIMDGDGSWKRIKGSAFRMALGPDLVRSTRFDAEIEGGEVVFNGKGWGHGVGLCQEGAYGMAVKGYGAFDILRYYYRGVILEKLKAEDEIVAGSR